MPNNVFPYPGNKARHSDWIISHLPEHECYVELFGGAAGVLFNKPRSKIEVYNDLNGDIPHFFQVLRDRGDELQEWLRNVPYSREIHEEWSHEFFNEEYRPDDDIERAGRYFFLRYSQWGGKHHGTSGFECSYQRNKAAWFQDKANQLDKFSDRIRGVQIESMDWDAVIEQYDSPQTAFYADPPYRGTEGNYTYGSMNHSKLANIARDIEGKVAISYGDLPPMYGSDFEIISKESGFWMDKEGGTKDATEYLIMNYDSEGEPIMSDHGQQTLTDISQSG